jgi:hypothetical protein
LLRSQNAGRIPIDASRMPFLRVNDGDDPLADVSLRFFPPLHFSFADFLN